MTLQYFKQEYRIAEGTIDPWGSSMSAHFELCAHLWMRGADLPHQWEYSPGMTDDPREPENYWHELFDQSSTDELLAIGWLLHRYEGLLKLKGVDY